MGHIGFTPQFKKKFKIEGDTVKKANKLLKEAKLIEKAGFLYKQKGFFNRFGMYHFKNI